MLNQSMKICLDYQTWNRNAPKSLLQYAVGALLYAPADHEGMIDVIYHNRIPYLNSVAFCLEDTIQDNYLKQAENKLIEHMILLYDAMKKGILQQKKLPLIFIRIRTPEQMIDIFRRLKKCQKILTGFILPKFDSKNKEEYKKAVLLMNKESEAIKYVMPTLETDTILKKETRQSELEGIKKTLDSIKKYVLNVRVGGNDFCNIYGLRRNQNQSIYDILMMQDVLSDISATFLEDYVVSGVVWEYFAGEADKTEQWKIGLQKELEKDKLNGFIGKTAIHPSQLSVIHKAYAVDSGDYEDAKAILNWKQTTRAVAKSVKYARMNESKVHQKWAEKIMALYYIYGIKEENYEI